jgi:atypical dual specificity phosphatase
MITKHPKSFEGYRCLAECSLEPKIRMLALAQALNLNPSLLRQTIEDLQQPLECSFGPTISGPESVLIPHELDAHLTKPWPDAIYGPEAKALHRMLWLNSTPPRETIKFLGYELPRNFSWIYPLKIAGMSTPRNEEDVDCLERMGVTDLLSLNKEGPLPRQWFKLKRIKHHQVMLENYAAPTCAEMDVIWDRVSAGGSWVIHCGGGVGRAGTVIACLMTMLGRGQEKDWEGEDGKKAKQDDQGMSPFLLSLHYPIEGFLFPARSSILFFLE